MTSEHKESQFILAPENLSAMFKTREDVLDEDIAKIVLPGWRYDQIAEQVLRMYEDTDAHIMPLDVFSIANTIGCSPIPYRAFGKRICNVLLEASKDAVTLQFFGLEHPTILYNDRQLPTRINFSIMHEIGHDYLGHKEPSPLAEKEANYFSALALCPVNLLSHYGISDAKTICQLFNVSDEMARHRLMTLQRRQSIVQSASERRFHRSVVSRFHFKEMYQMELFTGTHL